jgi:hypothetical protein
LAPVAYADPFPRIESPAVSSPCSHSEQNTDTAANSGEKFRCVSRVRPGILLTADTGITYVNASSGRGMFVSIENTHRI